MYIRDSLLRPEEEVMFKLRSLFSSYGYRRYKMSKFEEYDLYAGNKDFLSGGGILSFTNADGRLMALKPDVTMSIIRNFDAAEGRVSRVYYNENVYRASRGADGYREIMQAGLECMGDIDDYNVCEVLTLAARSLYAVSADCLLDISHMGLVSGAMDELGIDPARQKRLLACIREKNAGEAEALCRAWEVGEAGRRMLHTLVTSYGRPDAVLQAVEPELKNDKMRRAAEELRRICATLARAGYERNIRLDFSVVNDMNYYSGVVFQGFVNGIPAGILSGGRYDHMMRRAGKDAGAIGFAVRLDLLQRLAAGGPAYDVDEVLLYEADADIDGVLAAVKKLSGPGERVLAARTAPEGLRYRRISKFDGTEVRRADVDDKHSPA